MGKLDSIFLGADYSGDDDGGADFAEGKIKAVTADGITFTIPDYDDGKFEWGPSPYPRWSTGTGPQVGDRCLVLVPQGATIDPWVIGWWPAS